MLEKCVLTILELNWNQRLGHKKTKLNICYHMLTSSTQLQISSFHVVERTRTSTKCQKLKNARAKRAKILFFIVKYANLWAFCCRRRRGCLSSLMLRLLRSCLRKFSVWVNQYNGRKEKFSVGVKQYLRENSLLLRNSKTEPWTLPTSISSLCIVSQIGQLQMLFSYE